jgi:predicted aspartyl protease
MGMFRVPVDVGDAKGERWERVEATVDTGAAYTLVPEPVLARLGLAPAGHRLFRLPNGQRYQRDFTEARVRLNGETRTELVVFGDPDGPTLLGVHTLETFALAVDPVERRLVPAEALPL